MIRDILWAIEPAHLSPTWFRPTADLSAGPSTRQPIANLYPGKGGNSVAMISLAGSLTKSPTWSGTSTVQARREIRAASADPNVSGILLAIDSPGGTVAGTSDLAAEVKAARKRKPVWAHVDDLAASAAYWIASQADAVYVNSPTAFVGSIGTVLTVLDMSAAAEKEGIKVLRFSTGPLKGAGEPGTEITDEQKAEFQKLVEDAQTHFDAALKSGRGLTDRQLSAVRTGGLFSAKEAIDRKLIDGIRPLDATLTALASAK